MTWTNIKLKHDVPILELIDHARDDLRAEDFDLYIKPVQHHDVIYLFDGYYIYMETRKFPFGRICWTMNY